VIYIQEVKEMSIFTWKHAGLFLGGMLFQAKGIDLLASDKAHDLYVKTTALGLRCRDEVMKNVTTVREGCEDIYAEASLLNEERAGRPEIEVKVIEDKSKQKKAAKKVTKKTDK
jgi:hypothetical protein